MGRRPGGIVTLNPVRCIFLRRIFNHNISLAFFAKLYYYISKARFLNGVFTGGYATLTYKYLHFACKKGGDAYGKKIAFCNLRNYHFTDNFFHKSRITAIAVAVILWLLTVMRHNRLRSYLFLCSLYNQSPFLSSPFLSTSPKSSLLKEVCKNRHVPKYLVPKYLHRCKWSF